MKFPLTEDQAHLLYGEMSRYSEKLLNYGMLDIWRKLHIEINPYRDYDIYLYSPRLKSEILMTMQVKKLEL